MIEADIVIVGGGTVGCTLAQTLLQQTNYSITLVERTENEDAGEHPAFDARVIALSGQSVDALSNLGVDFNQANCTDIEHILVTDKGHLGQCRLHATDFNKNSFGKVIGLQALGQMLSLPTNHPRLNLLCPDSVLDITTTEHNVQLSLASQNEIQTKLIVFADGGRSDIANQLGFIKQSIDYGQTALVCNLDTNQPHEGWAHERFTENGPLAFLPFYSHQTVGGSTSYSVVWTQPHNSVEHMLSMRDKDFSAALQKEIGYRHGIITKLSKRFSYPLALQRVTRCFQHRAVVVGNAAQALHPIAGQGFNLGLRDALGLVTVLKECNDKTGLSSQNEGSNISGSEPLDPGKFEVLSKYAHYRQADKQSTISITDSLVRMFSNQHVPLVVGRNLGLVGLNFCRFSQSQFIKQTLGYGTSTSRHTNNG